MATIEQFDSGRDNNFDLIRFIAASMVIFSHSYFLTGNELNEPLQKLCGLVDFGSLGVKIFFAISGYLILKSVYRQPTLNSFVWARMLRIFPGLIATSIFCALIIGPLCTTLPLKDYFTHSAVYDFIWREATLHNYPNQLPGVFAINPIPNNVNSPVWTLPGELLMYFCVLLWGAGLLIYKRQFNFIKVISLLFAVSLFLWGIGYTRAFFVNNYSWAILFFAGGACYLLRNKIVLSVPFLLGMIVVFLALFHYRFKYIDLVFDLVLVYGLLICAYHPKLQVKGFHKLGDFSYGLYIYTFPVQQTIVAKLPGIKPAALFFSSYAVALCLAALSWYFIEKPMLRLKTIKSPQLNRNLKN